jgi:hypothetical protein
MTGLPTTTLITVTPCCKRAVRIVALHDVPKEVYERTCRGCGQPWWVERRIARDEPGKRIDVLEWTEKA